MTLFSVEVFCQENSDFLPIEVNRRWGFINKEGKIVIEPKFISVGTFSEGLTTVQLDEIDKSYKTENGGFSTYKNAYINEKGEIVLVAPFDEIRNFVNGLAAVRIGDKHEKYFYPGKYGFIDKTGKLVIQPQFDAVSDYFSEDLGLFKIGEKWGFFNKDRKIVIEANFRFLENFSEGLATACKNNKCGFIDKTGEFVIKPQFDNARGYNNGIAKVKLKKYSDWFWIDKTGKIIGKIDDFYKSQNILPKEYPISKVVNGKKVFVDELGKVVFENKWDNFTGFKDGVALVYNNDKKNYWCGLYVPGWIWITDACFHWGYINNKGEYIWKQPELN